jgi:hypothetical protein
MKTYKLKITFISITSLLLFLNIFNNVYAEEKFINAPSGLTLRETPDLKGKKIIIIPFNEKVNVIASDNRQVIVDNIKDIWVKVNWKNNEGWVFNGYLRLKKDNPEQEIHDGSIVKDLESFKKSQPVGKTRIIDINNDGADDIVAFCSQGEDIYLRFLIKKTNYYVVLEVPVGLEYDFIKHKENNYIKIGTGTFPMYGNIHGPDIYNWYDFYKVEGTKLIIVNDLFSSFYVDMGILYNKRINELENEIESEKKQSTDQVFLNLHIGFKRDHIKQYEKFIIQANEIIAKSKKR